MHSQNPAALPPQGRFTGGHMLLIMISFFGVVIAVNSYLAYKAVSTFTGTVVDNSYVASQHYNQWLAQGRAEQALGWHTQVRLDAQRHVIVGVTDRNGRALSSLDVAGYALDALRNIAPAQMKFFPLRTGEMVSTTPLPVGRSNLELLIRSGGRSIHTNMAFH